MKIIGWIILIYLIYRISEYMFAAGRRSAQKSPKKTTVIHQDKQTGTKVTPRDSDGEYIDYKEVK